MTKAAAVGKDHGSTKDEILTRKEGSMNIVRGWRDEQTSLYILGVSKRGMAYLLDSNVHGRARDKAGEAEKERAGRRACLENPLIATSWALDKQYRHTTAACNRNLPSTIPVKHHLSD